MGGMSRDDIQACRRKIDDIVGEVERDAVDVDDLFREATLYRMRLAAKLSRLRERLNAEVAAAAAAAGVPVPPVPAVPPAGPGVFRGRADSGVESPAAAGGRQTGSAADPFFSPIDVYSPLDTVIAQRGQARGPVWI